MVTYYKLSSRAKPHPVDLDNIKIVIILGSAMKQTMPGH